MRGNLVELAVAFVMATPFGAVVTAAVKVVMDIIGKIGGTPNFSDYTPGGIHIGQLLTTLIAFVVLAAIVYIVIVMPYQTAMARFAKPDATPLSEDTQLLMEIRDLLSEPRR
jgi:large conductance mechanosensitive channel